MLCKDNRNSLIFKDVVWKNRFRWLEAIECAEAVESFGGTEAAFVA
jgi:hypothetical protein